MGSRLSAVGVGLAVWLAATAARADETNATAALAGEAASAVSLAVNASLQLAKGNVDSLVTGGGATLTLAFDPSEVALSVQAQHASQGGSTYAESVESHVRYRHALTSALAGEAWSTHEYQKFQGLKTRLMLGAGPAYERNWSNQYGLQVGAGYLFEYEKLGSQAGPEAGDATTASRVYLYTVAAATIREGVQVSQALFVRPRVDGSGPIDDVRLVSSTGLSVALSTHLSLKNALEVDYDSKPPLPIDDTDISLTVSLVAKL